MNKLRNAAFLGSLIVVVGCENAPTAPNSLPLVMELELHTTREGLIAEATVTNHGTDTVNYLGGCGGSIHFTVLDDKGNDLLRCLEIQCEGEGVPLYPGETKEARYLFEGQVCDQSSVEPGWYEVVATLAYLDSSDLKQLQERQGFRWKGGPIFSREND